MPTLASIARTLMRRALALPGTFEDHPWGDTVVKVGAKKTAKICLFAGVHEGTLHVTAKLPRSGLLALALPFAKPTGYGLGKSGWVTASFERAEDVPVPMLEAWVDESYEAVAPKKLARGAPEGKKPKLSKKAPAKEASASKAAAKKAAPAKRAAPAVRGAKRSKR